MKKIFAFAALALSLAATGRLWATEVTWKSSVTEGNWNDANNWDSGSVPGNNDTAKFSSSATVTINTSGTTYCYIASIVIDEDATVTFKGSGNNNPKPLCLGGNITGSGKLKFAGGLIFQANKAVPEIEPDIEIVEGTTSRLNMNHSDGANTNCYFKLKGKLTGSGTLIGWHSNDTANYGIEFSGDNSGFAGVYEVQDGYGADSTRDNTVFANASATSASATWNLIGAYSQSKKSWADMLDVKPSSNSENVTYNFGAISNIYTSGNGTYTQSNSVNGGSFSCMIVNIGGNNADSATAGDLGYATPHKTGIGKLELSAKNAYSIFIDAGTLYIASSNAAPQSGRLIFNGDGATLATATDFDISQWKSGNDYKQPLKGNKTYPICFSNATSEVHYWGTALHDSNTAGLKKIGDGSLHLGAAPSCSTLPITVEGGTLAIKGSINAANVTLKPADPAAAASAGTVLFWAETVSSGTPTLDLDPSLTALYRLKTTTNASLTINGTAYPGTAYSIEKCGVVIGTDTKISLGTSDLATAEAATNGWTIALSDARTSSGQTAEYFKITLVQEDGGYYVSYALDEAVVRPTLNTPEAFGISGGNTSFAVDNVKTGLWYSVVSSGDVDASSYTYPKTTEKNEAGKQATNDEAINLSLPLPTDFTVRYYRIAVDDVEPAWTSAE